MRIRIGPKTLQRYLHIALAAVATVHIGKSRESILLYCRAFECVTIDGVWTCEWTYWTHHSELQTLTALTLILTLTNHCCKQ
jgi:hypothetical protein